MKPLARALGLAVLLMAGAEARAVSGVLCLAVTSLSPPPLGTGSPMLSVSTPAGDAYGWWCKTTNPATGKLAYSMQSVWALKHFHNVVADSWVAVAHLLAASEPVVAVNAEVSAATRNPDAGSQDDYEVAVLKRNICIALTTKPYVAPIADPPAGYCGAAPTPPWSVAPSGASPWRYAWTRVGQKLTATAGKATVGLACDCGDPLVLSGFPYCTFTGAASASVVTLCTKR